MGEESPRLVRIRFEVIGIPDSPGLRIRSLDPWGIYVSIRNAAAAQYYLKLLAVELVDRRKLLETRDDQGLITDKEPDWDAALLCGIGEIGVRVMDMAEAVEQDKQYLMRLAGREGRVQASIQTGKDRAGGLDYQAAHDPKGEAWVDMITDHDLALGAHLKGSVPPYLIRSVE